MRLKNRILYICIMICAMLLSVGSISAQEQPPLTVKAKADSTTLVMGDRTTVNVEILKNSHDGAFIDIPVKGKDYFGLELQDIAADSTDLGNGRIQLNYRMIFQAFDPSELLTLPGFRYAVDGDTVKSDFLTFKVLPVDLSPELGDINDIENLKIHPDESVQSIKMRWYDYVPEEMIWVLIAAALIALAVTLYLLYKKNGPKIFVPRKPIPPYELAITNLKKLKDKRLIENGLAKQFYTEVTDIWRKYLEGRFGISAMEMTSRQILKQLRENKETHLSAQNMEQLLELSDFVKFAALSPSRDEMVRTYDTIYSFVEATRPEPELEENKDNKNNNIANQK